MEHVDAVVVGSGFGGAVAAYRLAEAGLSVVVLERGRPYPPGSFPRGPAGLGRAFWDPDAGLYGMFEVRSFRHCDSVVASGLGGGSLIYANVLLRKDEEWFVHQDPHPEGGPTHWPVSRAELEPHYDAVERMIGVSPYPLGHPAYADTLKTLAMRDAAAELGLDWRLPPLAISFAPTPDAEPGLGLPIVDPEYGSAHGVLRRTCRLCGECDIGCNDGAKNSLDHTYLAAARRKGADLRTLHEVRGIQPRPGGGYDVGYVEHLVPAGADGGNGTGRPKWTGPHTISCDRLVLAAGTYGTSYLLLRGRAAFPGLSRTLGTRFSGNGDLLAFLLRARDRSRTRPINASRGPVITSAIRLDETRGPGGYIEDGGYPAFVDYLVESANVGEGIGRAATFVLERLRALFRRDSNLSAELSRLIGRGELSGSSLPLLGMGLDVPDGELRVRDGELELVWSAETSREYYEGLRTAMRRISDVLGAEYTDSPSWWRRRTMTVHPLGGAPMGRHPGEGVCDPFGEVFGYPGLYIADGAALPGPVGANPALTIAAMADRMCTRLLDTRTPRHVTGGTRGVTPPVSRGERTSLWFVEEMRGELRREVRDLPGEVDRCSFRLTITIDDVDRFLTQPSHEARVDGWIDTAIREGRRPITRGWFNLLAPTGAPDHRQMRYRLHFSDQEGRPRTLSGVKDVRQGPLTRLWPETSTLHTRLLDGHVPEGADDAAKVLATGTLRVTPSDLTRMLTTFRTNGPCEAAALARFCRFFLGELWEIYGPRQTRQPPPR